jgi:hypothetical protein
VGQRLKRGFVSQHLETGETDVVVTQGVKSPKIKDPRGKEISSPSLSRKRGARAAHTAGIHTAPPEPMEKRKPNEEGGKVWLEREGKRGKGQQAVGNSRGDKRS